MRCVVLAPLFFVSLWCATEGIIFSMLTKGRRIKRAGADRAEQVPAQRLLSDLTKHHPDRNIDKRDGNLDDTYHQGLFTDGSQVDDVTSKDAAKIAEEMRSRLKSFEARRQGEAVKSVLKEDDDLSLLDQIDSVLGAPLKKALLEVLDNEIKDTDKPSTTEKKSNSEKIDDKNNKDYPFYPENSIPNQNSDDTVKTSKVDTATRNLASFKTGVGKSRPRTRVLVAASAPLADHNAVQKKGEMSASPSQRKASTAAKNPGSDSFIAEKETQKPQTRFLVAPDRATEENRNENDAAVSSQHQQQAKVVDKKESISSSLATRGQMSHFQMRYLVAPDAPITEEKARKQEAMADHNAVQKKDEVSAADSFVADRENQKPHTRFFVAPVHAKDENRNDNAAADVSSRQQTQTAVKKENTASSLTTRGQNLHFKTRFFVAPDAPMTEEKAREQDASTSDVADDRNVDESYPELEEDVGNEELDEDLEGEEDMEDDNGELEGDLEMEESRDENDELDEDLEGDESNDDDMELDEDLNESEVDQDLDQGQDVDQDQGQDVDLDQDMDQDKDAEAQVNKHPNRVEQVPVKASVNHPSAFYPEQVRGYHPTAVDKAAGAKVDQASRAAAKAYIAAREKEGTFVRRYFVAPDAPISDSRASKKSASAMVKKSKVDSDAMEKIPDDLEPSPEDGFDDDDESGKIEKRAWSRKKCDLNCVKDTVMCSNKTQADQNIHVTCGYNPNLKYTSVKRSSFTICTAPYRLKLSCSRNKKCFYTRGCYGLFEVEYCYHTCDFAYYSKK